MFFSYLTNTLLDGRIFEAADDDAISDIYVELNRELTESGYKQLSSVGAASDQEQLMVFVLIAGLRFGSLYDFAATYSEMLKQGTVATFYECNGTFACIINAQRTFLCLTQQKHCNKGMVH